MIHLDTSVLVDALTGPKRSAPRLRGAIESGERVLLTALVLYEWLRGHRYMLCNRQPTAVEEGMQPLLPSRHMGGRLGLCDGHHLGGHEWKEAWPA